MVAVLNEVGKSNIKPVIFLDEAHLMSESCWKTIKMLWEEYVEEDTPVSIVAFAQPVLRGILRIVTKGIGCLRHSRLTPGRRYFINPKNGKN